MLVISDVVSLGNAPNAEARRGRGGPRGDLGPPEGPDRPRLRLGWLTEESMSESQFIESADGGRGIDVDPMMRGVGDIHSTGSRLVELHEGSSLLGWLRQELVPQSTPCAHLLRRPWPRGEGLSSQ